MLLKKMQQYWMSILKDKKIFMGNYYICKIFAMILIVLIVFTGCGQNRITEKEEKKEKSKVKECISFIPIEYFGVTLRYRC